MVDDDNKFDDQFYDDEDAAFEEEFGNFDDDSLEDEFSNELDEEGEVSDEDWNEEDFDGSDLIATKKKGFLSNVSFNTMVISGAIIVGLGVMIFQVIAKKPEVVDTGFRSSVKMQGASDGVVFGDNQVETVEIKAEPAQETNQQIGILEDPSQLDSIDTTIDDAPPMPVSISAETLDDEKILLEKDFSENMSLKAELMGDTQIEEPLSEESPIASQEIGQVDNNEMPRAPEQQQDLNNQAVILEIPEIESDLVADAVVQPGTDNFQNNLPGTVAENSTEPEISPTEAEVTSDIVMSEGGEIIDLSDDEEATAERAEVSTGVQEGVSPPDAQTDLVGITDRLKLMETKIGGLEKKFENQPAVQSDDIKKLNETVAALQKEIARLKSEAQKKPSSAPKKTASKKAPAAKTANMASNQWELRAAQPGKAWVSQKGKSDLQPVVVGDILSGLGRIQSISYIQGKWVIQTTSGQIRQ